MRNSIPPSEPPPNSTNFTGSLDFLHSISDTQLITWVHNTVDKKYTTPVRLNTLRSHQIRLQADGGANRPVTNLKEILTVYWDIAPHEMGGIGDGITCTGKGLFH